MKQQKIPPKTGYRLPSSDEWEYTARYRSDNTNVVDDAAYTNPWFTKGDSASGAIANYTDIPACHAVGFYSGSVPTPSDEAVVKSLGVNSANALGLYDMSGNVLEWCFAEDSPVPLNRINRGGCWSWSAYNMRVSSLTFSYPDYEYTDLGFRLCRTGD